MLQAGEVSSVGAVKGDLVIRVGAFGVTEGVKRLFNCPRPQLASSDGDFVFSGVLLGGGTTDQR